MFWLAVFVDDLLPIPGCIAMVCCGQAIFCHMMLGVGYRVKALVEQRILAKYTLLSGQVHAILRKINPAGNIFVAMEVLQANWFIKLL